MDERFSKVHKDPRFKKIPKKDRKVKIDSRFEKMFTDERFHTKFTVDKRGKPINHTEKEDLHKFYEIESEEEEIQNDETEENLQRKKTESSTKKEIIKSGRGKERKKKKIKEESAIESDSSGEVDFNDIRGTAPQQSDSSESEASDEEVDFADLEEGIIHGWGELDEEAKRIEGAETCRLAVCNCDWDKISASDLFVLFHSFKPTGGSLKEVTVYPSDYGIERMQEEDLKGPVELKDTIIGDDDEEEENEGKTEGSKYHMEKLREYQLNRMKYFYAVVECDSIDTANKIYEECDGMEYEMSATRLDLRFIPQDMEFENPPKSTCKSLPNIKSYQPVNFLNTALQQSTVRLTWDQTDPKRLESTMRKFTKDDLENMDFKDYLASSSGEEDEEEITTSKNTSKNIAETALEEVDENEMADTDDSDDENDQERIKKYRLLMQEIESKENTDLGEEANGNMEVTWTPGMDSIGEEILEKMGNDDSTCKTKKKNITNKKILRNSDSDSEVDSDGLIDDEIDNDMEDNSDAEEISDSGFNDPFFTQHDTDETKDKKQSKNKRKKKKAKELSDEHMTEEEKRAKKELELLLLDEDDDKKHFSLKAILDQEKNSKSKKKRRKKDKIVEEDTFKVDVNDPRFNALYSSHLYAIDPAQPNFKKTKATEAILKEKQRRREDSIQNPNEIEKSVTAPTSNNTSLSALIKSVKTKTVSHQQSKKRRKLK